MARGCGRARGSSRGGPLTGAARDGREAARSPLVALPETPLPALGAPEPRLVLGFWRLLGLGLVGLVLLLPQLDGLLLQDLGLVQVLACARRRFGATCAFTRYSRPLVTMASK